jgi:hypothetical protein
MGLGKSYKMQKQDKGEKYQFNDLSRTPAQISIPISHYYSNSARGTKDLLTVGFNPRKSINPINQSPRGTNDILPRINKNAASCL